MTDHATPSVDFHDIAFGDAIATHPQPSVATASISS
jgi:hypothetical protein